MEDRELLLISNLSQKSDLKKDAPNVLMLASDFIPSVGGIQTYLHNICKNLKSYNLTVIAPKEGHPEYFDALQKYKTERVGLKILSSVAKIKIISFLILGVARTLKISKNQGVDIIVCGHILTGVIGLLLKKTKGIPYVVCTYALEIMNKRLKKLNHIILRNADSIVTISDFTREYLTEIGIDGSKIEKAQPAIEMSNIYSKVNAKEIIDKYNLNNKKLILTVGSISILQRYKGMDMVLRALPEVLKVVPELKYLIVGKGSDKDYLQRIINELGLHKHVVFTGYVEESELPKYYTACDVFIMPSREIHNRKGILAEGFGIVFLEANACGKPVIGGRSGGIPDAILDGETGLLVDPVNVVEIASSLIKLLTDENFAKSMGEKGKKRVTEKFTWDRTAAKVEIVLDKLSRQSAMRN